MILSNNILILLDRVVGEKIYDGIVVSWSDMIVPSEIISLPVKTEEQAISLKEEFLRWLYEIGKSEVGGRSMVSHFKIFDNLSFWWLTSVAEKSPFLCRSIFQVFKLRTLEKIYSGNHCQGLVYHGNNSALHSILKKWSLGLGHSYKWNPSSADRAVKSGVGFCGKLIRKSPYLLQGIGWFIKRWFGRWRHVNSIRQSVEEPGQTARPTIVTFFPNIHMDQVEKGDFRSKYWERFHDYLKT